jgi:activator of 2-hydroxyglutaryl-CoA dehydratase
VEDIIAGIHDAIAGRVTRMIGRLEIVPDVLFTGGVAQNIGVVNALREKLNCELLVPEKPLLSGALGAALFGKEIVEKAQSQNKPVPKGERRLEQVTFFS